MKVTKWKTVFLMFAFVMAGFGHSSYVQAQNIDDEFTEARALVADGNYQEALHKYTQIIEQDHNNWQAYRGRGICLICMGELSEAIKDFAIANKPIAVIQEGAFPGLGTQLGIQENWQKSRPLFQAGDALFANSQYDRAAAKFQESLAVYRYDPKCLFELSGAYLALKKFQPAEVASIRAICYRDTDWRYWRQLGLAFELDKKYHHAIDVFKHTLKLNPPDSAVADIKNDLASTETSMKKDAEAANAGQTLLNSGPIQLPIIAF